MWTVSFFYVIADARVGDITDLVDGKEEKKGFKMIGY